MALAQCAMTVQKSLIYTLMSEYPVQHITRLTGGPALSHALNRAQLSAPGLGGWLLQSLSASLLSGDCLQQDTWPEDQWIYWAAEQGERLRLPCV